MVRGKWLLVLGMMQGHVFVSGESALQEACSSSEEAQCGADLDDVAMLQVQKVAMSTREGDEKPAIAGDVKPAVVTRQSQEEPEDFVAYTGDRALQLQSSARYIEALRSTDPAVKSFELQMAEIANAVYLSENTTDWKILWHKVVKSDISKKENDRVAIYEKRSHNKHECVIAFAGSNSLLDFTNNVDLDTKSFCGMDKKFHHGFINELTVFAPVANEGAVEIVTHKHCADGLYMVGHSLGAALAEIFINCIDNLWDPAVGTLPPIRGAWTFAGPGVSKVQLTDDSDAGHHRDHCFLGTRFYIKDEYWGDAVPVATYPFGFFHPKLKAVKLQEQDSVYSKSEYACFSNKAKKRPNSVLIPSVEYHGMVEHVKRVKEVYPPAPAPAPAHAHA